MKTLNHSQQVGSIAILLIFLANSHAGAADLKWDGGSGGGSSWTSSSGHNWNPDQLPTTSDNLTLDNSIVDVPGSMTISASSGAIGAQTITFANNFNPDNTTVIGSGSHTTAQTLTIGGAGTGSNPLIQVLSTSGTVTFQPLNLGSATESLGLSLGVSGSISVAEGGTLRIDSDIGESSAGLGINKTGNGTLILGGANTYTGGTALSGGTVQMGSNAALGTGGVTFAGGQLNANDHSATLGALSLTANSTLNLVADSSGNDLTFTSATASGGILTINNWLGNESGGTDDKIFFTGLASSSFLDNVQFAGWAPGAAISFNNELVPISPVPEPISMALGIFAVGFTGAGMGRRFFRRRQR